MKAERPLKVVFFKTEAGNEPVREWLKDLPKEDCKVIGTDIGHSDGAICVAGRETAGGQFG